MVEGKSSKSKSYSTKDNHFKCYSHIAYFKKKYLPDAAFKLDFLYWYFRGSENSIIYSKFNTGWDEL